VPGCREIALNEQTGLLVPVGQSQPLADAIARLAQSKTLRDEYGMAARQLVVEKMSSARIGHAIVELYKTR
jgi:glycosyltransferase involved in cell wall biosynthesis